MDLISRQEAIDELDDGAELLRRALDNADIVGAEREKYEWGLGLIESYISDIKELPSAERKGHWIGERLIYPSGIITFIYRCSECGCEERNVYEDTKPSNYCPDCGTRMEASEWTGTKKP